MNNGVLAMCTQCPSLPVPMQIVNIITLIYNAIRIAVPIILVFVGMLGLAKAITSQKEDEIKKAQNLLVKQAITAGLIFLMLSLVRLVFGLVADVSETNEIFGCIDAFLSGCK